MSTACTWIDRVTKESWLATNITLEWHMAVTAAFDGYDDAEGAFTAWLDSLGGTEYAPVEWTMRIDGQTVAHGPPPLGGVPVATFRDLFIDRFTWSLTIEGYPSNMTSLPLVPKSQHESGWFIEVVLGAPHPLVPMLHLPTELEVLRRRRSPHWT